MKWGDPEFERLKREWYAKLKATGFDDAEDHKERLLRPSSLAYRELGHSAGGDLVRQSKEEYFTLIGQCAADELFDDPAERLIMLRHAEGTPIKEISAELRGFGLKCHRMTVRRVIHRFEDLWGVRPRPKSRRPRDRQAS